MNLFESDQEVELRQLAVRRLAKVYAEAPGVGDWLASQLDHVDQKTLATGLALDVLRACESSGSEGLIERAMEMRMGQGENRVADHFWALDGGDARRGQKVFAEHPIAQCIRCHSRDGSGGVSGPALDQLSAKRNRRHILQSIVEPSAEISEGYSAENGLSSMPEVHWILEPEEIRDLLEFISSK